ncbi:unnamed protein product [Soboliphyme baturini]|uniref:Nesprin-1 n=1 Tax=Soboliphyme baturini TaxID=241478 RepID=A0A183IW44_9BILA|nr:unnamed protein product [Soboliphyme baturini]
MDYHKKIDMLAERYHAIRDEAEKDEVEVGPQAEKVMKALFSNWNTVSGMASEIQAALAKPNADQTPLFHEDNNDPEQQPLVTSTSNGHDKDTREVESALFSYHYRDLVSSPESVAATKKTSEEPDGKSNRFHPPLMKLRADEIPSSVSGRQRDLHELLRFRNWLLDSEQEYSSVCNVASLKDIRESQKKLQKFLSMLNSNKMQLLIIFDKCKDSEIRHKAELLTKQWDRCITQSESRKHELSSMLDDCRAWENLKAELEVWLNDSQAKASGTKINESHIEELEKELHHVEILFAELDLYKNKITTFGKLSNRLIDCYVDDDTSEVSQVTSDLNTMWTKLNDK